MQLVVKSPVITEQSSLHSVAIAQLLKNSFIQQQQFKEQSWVPLDQKPSVLCHT